MVGSEILWQLYLWYSYFFQANCFIAYAANEMYMVIVVVACFAIVFTQGV
jgi:hypothetical protein